MQQLYELNMSFESFASLLTYRYQEELAGESLLMSFDVYFKSFAFLLTCPYPKELVSESLLMSLKTSFKPFVFLLCCRINKAIHTFQFLLQCSFAALSLSFSLISIRFGAYLSQQFGKYTDVLTFCSSSRVAYTVKHRISS